MPKKKNQLATIPSESTELETVSKEARMLQSMVNVETEKRTILKEYITKHMVDGVDFGGIHIAKNCPNKYDCKNPNHFSKASLFKPGAEKFLSLMQLKARYRKDEDSWVMGGSQNGMFCYICELLNSKNEVIGEGRGSASIQEKGNMNTAIKLAEKRAKVDAVLSTGGLSDFFTQDLEDMPQEERQTYSSPKKKPLQKPVMATNEQRQIIMSLVKLKGKTPNDLKAYFIRAFNIDSGKKLTYIQAQKTISQLKKLPDSQPIDPDPAPIENEVEIDSDEIDAGIQKMRAENQAKEGAMYPESIQ